MTTEATLNTVEKTLDVIEDQLDTLERIPKVHLNGTTKTQQYVILGVTAAVSAAIGAGVTYKFVSRKLRLKYEEISNKEIEEARRYYMRQAEKYEREVETAVVKEARANAEADTSDDPVRTMDEVIQNLEYDTSAGTVVAEDGTLMLEDPVEGGLPTVNSQLDRAAAGFYWDQEVEESKRDPAIPYVITAEEFLENYPSHEQTKLTYYDGGNVGVVANSDDIMIPDHDVDAWIGFPNLNRFGHGSDDRYTVYVRNEVRGEDYEIVLSTRSFARDVMGMDDDPDSFEDNKRRVRRLRDM